MPSLHSSLGRNLFRAVILFAGVAASGLSASAATVVLTASKDNTLFQPSAPSEDSNGAGDFIFSGLTTDLASRTLRRGVIAFDLADAIPEDAVITGVTLTLYLSRTTFSSAPVDVSLHRLLADWGEGTSTSGPTAGGSGAPATTGDATWTYRFFNDSTKKWATPGGDFVVQASATAKVGNFYSDPQLAYSWSGSGMVTDVQAWLDNPSDNFGWIIRGDESDIGNSKRFNSRDNSDVSTRPQLTIQYEVVPEPSTIGLLAAGALLFGSRARRRSRRIGGVAFLCVIGLPLSMSMAAGPIAETIPKGTIGIGLESVAAGLTAPNLLLSPSDGTNRQFILDQDGQVSIIQNGTLLSTPFLDVSSQMVALNRNYDERGLLGFAFDPGFADPASPGFRRVFTYTSESVNGTADLSDPYATTLDHQSVVASWRVDPADPNRVDPSSRQVVLRIDQPQSNHNGGMIVFGPDNNLYIGLGDGGGANDTPAGHNPTIGNAQDNNIALGKILRINVNGTDSANGKYGIPTTNPFANGGGVKEIYASGFRNPYRFSFDGDTLLVGDVGQNQVEELDQVELGKNYGWRYKEGTFKFNSATGTVSTDLSGLPEDLVEPILQYDHDDGISILGGYVYHGTLIPELVGKYVFGDFGLSFSKPSGRLFYADLETKEIHEFLLGGTNQLIGLFVKGLGQDQNGELYLLGGTTLGPSGTTGVVMRIVPEPTVMGLGAIGLTLLATSRRRRF